MERERDNETIDIHYLTAGHTDKMNFSFITRISIPVPLVPGTTPISQSPALAFSADGSKFAIAMDHSRVSVWDIRSKVLVKTFMEVPKESDYRAGHVRCLQFSSGKSREEVLVFVEVCLMFTF